MKTLKTKIFAGLLFLLVLILSLSLTGIISIYYLSSDSNEIIKDNYASLGYCNNMLNSLENIFNEVIKSPNSKLPETRIPGVKEKLLSEQNYFEKNLDLQKNNITEPGEGILVNSLLKLYSDFKSDLIIEDKISGSLTLQELNHFQQQYLKLRAAVKDIYEVNHQAVYNKSKIAHRTADKVSLIMAIATAISILLTIAFIIYFPSYITNPVVDLTKKIKDISKRKYDQQITVKSNDEFRTLAEAFNNMTVKLKEYETQHIDELILEKRRIETLVANLQDGSVLLDDEFRVLHANNKFCELADLAVEDVIGKHLYEIENRNVITGIFTSLSAENIKSALTNFKDKISINLKNQPGHYKLLLLEINKSARSEKQKDPSGYIVLLQNITSFVERDLAKTNLIATVSHELKTPLSSINLSLKLLEDSRVGSLNSEQKELVESVKQHSNRILKLVNEVLDFTQAETGQIKLKISEHEINDIIEFGTFAVLMMLNEKEIDLNVSLTGVLPKVKCDIEKTVWVIVNLLTNAIRYSQRNNKIIISAEKINKFVKFSVRDFGAGIPEAEQNRIFEKYVTSSSKAFKGTGLGLAIAKEFVEVQGGEIGFDSNIKNGSLFYFTLPVA